MSRQGNALPAEGATLLSRQQAQALADRVLRMSPADQTRVTIASSRRGNTRFALNQISTAGDDFNTTVTVRSLFGKRSANVTTNEAADRTTRALAPPSWNTA